MIRATCRLSPWMVYSRGGAAVAATGAGALAPEPPFAPAGRPQLVQKRASPVNPDPQFVQKDIRKSYQLSAYCIRLMAFHILLIRLATYPAPKPLSMLTTVTLLAQLFSMPSSAARP